MSQTPHLGKLNAAIRNPKCRKDVTLLQQALRLYEKWVSDLNALTSSGRERVREMVALLNEYKDTFEIEMVMKRGTPFLRRQKGQLKLDNSIIEEFLVHLVRPEVLKGLGETKFLVGPQKAFMSLCFRPTSFSELDGKPGFLRVIVARAFLNLTMSSHLP